MSQPLIPLPLNDSPASSSSPPSRMGRVLRGLFANWFSMVLATGIGFFLSPFVVHRLGTALYGVWVLSVAIAAYMSLLDLGLRGAIMRYVSRGHATGDHEESSKVLSAALALRLGMSGISLIGSAAIAYAAPVFFHMPPELSTAARLTIFLAGVNVGLSLIFGVFGGVLMALHEFATGSAVTMVQTVLRAVGIVVILMTKHGIVAMAGWDVIVQITTGILQARLCFAKYPELQVLFCKPAGTILRQLWSYSSYVILVHVGAQLTYYSDNMVVGNALSTTSVAFYSIGGSLTEYLRQIVVSLTSMITPVASSLDATGDRERLRQLFLKGTIAAYLIGLPIAVALFFRGQTFIGLWMGKEFAPVSGQVLQILVLAQFIAIGNFAGGGILFGTGKHGIAAYWTLGEGVANLILSVVLVRRIGVMGVAWGTTIPALFLHLFLRPQYVCRVVEMPLFTYLRQSWVRCFVAALPYAVACYYADKYWSAGNLFHFMLQMCALLPVFVICAGVMFRMEVSEFLAQRRNARISE